MERKNYTVARLAIMVWLGLSLVGWSQSISDLVSREKMRELGKTGTNKVLTNEDLNGARGHGTLSSSSRPVSPNEMHQKGSNEKEGERQENLTGSSAWLNGAEDYNKAINEYRKMKKPLILYFYTDWCGYCKKFNSAILSTSEFKQFMRSVISVKINPETGHDEHDIAYKYNVMGYPSFFIFRSDSNQPQPIHPFFEQHGQLKAMDPSKFIQMCKEKAGI